MDYINDGRLFVEGRVVKKIIPNIAVFEFEYPYVYINFNNSNIVDDNNLELFFNLWLRVYEEKMPYIIVFDGTMIEYAKPKFIFRFAKFMKKLRKQTPQYLQYSIIIINNSLMRGLMNMVFRIQAPVAPVYLCESADKLEEIHNKIHNKVIQSVEIIDKNDVSEEEVKKIYFDNNYKEEEI
tara:strand:+ start:807 stop:1349 length:543 start_codon:yes stop_codon:yes gene_type:complete